MVNKDVYIITKEKQWENDGELTRVSWLYKLFVDDTQLSSASHDLLLPLSMTRMKVTIMTSDEDMMTSWPIWRHSQVLVESATRRYWCLNCLRYTVSDRTIVIVVQRHYIVAERKIKADIYSNKNDLRNRSSSFCDERFCISLVWFTKSNIYIEQLTFIVVLLANTVYVAIINHHHHHHHQYSTIMVHESDKCFV